MVKRTASNDIFAEFFSAWRLWLLGALLGALAAGLAFQILPPDYRAQATVVVDNNLEEAWQYFPDRQLFQFLQRETERLEQLAWSDEVIQGLASAGFGYTAEQLRTDVLVLSHPSDGGWHLYASATDPAAAQALASDWAESFVAAVQAAVQQAPELEAARAALSEALLASAEPDPAELRPLLENLAGLAERTKGISIYTELYLSQSAELPVSRSVSLATYLLAGSIAGALAAPLYVLLRPAASPRKR